MLFLKKLDYVVNVNITILLYKDLGEKSMNNSLSVKKRNYTRLSWDDWYRLAKDFYRSNHHLKIPNHYKTSDGYLLGRWIERQRTAYHQKNVYKIDARKIGLLELEESGKFGMNTVKNITRKKEISTYQKDLHTIKQHWENGLFIKENAIIKTY